MVDHPVDGGGGDDRIAEIIAEFLEVDVGGDDVCIPVKSATDSVRSRPPCRSEATQYFF
ncbi:MAG: hypothetical protein Q8M56_01515 [Desulfobacterales bacterium]|nr:hypothetical protein [Desulfobacterales bacterium]